MGTSFIKYKGFGFWSRDSFIESWLTTLIVEMRKLQDDDLKTWQHALIEEWRIQIIIDGGCMSLRLDEFLIDGSREGFMLSLAKRALNFSDPLGRETGELFIKLLEGQLETNESSPIDYLHWPEEH
jgi:hypothetical protein